MSDVVTVARVPLSDVKVLVSVAAKKDARRPVLTGVLVGDDGWCVATDSYRMHAVNVGSVAGSEERVLVPAGVLSEAARGKAGRPPELAVCRVDNLAKRELVGGHEWAVQGPGGPVGFVPVEGAFPRWRELVPAEGVPSASWTFNRDRGVIETLRHLAKPVPTKNVAPEMVVLVPSEEPGGTCELRWRGMSGPAEGLSVVWEGDRPEPVGFNVRFLLAALESDGGMSETTLVSRGLRPATVGSIEHGRVHLLMPMRV